MVAPALAVAGRVAGGLGLRSLGGGERREFGFSVKADIREMTRDLNFVQRRLTPRVVRLALNSTGRWVERRAVAVISRQTNVQKSRIRWRYEDPSGIPGKRLPGGGFRKGTVGATKSKKRRLVYRTAADNDLVFRIDWIPRNRGPSVSWAAIGARQSAAGTRTNKGHSSSRAFINWAKGSTLQVYRREGAGRYPIDVMRVRFLQIADRAFERTINRSRPKFRAEFERLMAVELEKTGQRLPTKSR